MLRSMRRGFTGIEVMVLVALIAGLVAGSKLVQQQQLVANQASNAASCFGNTASECENKPGCRFNAATTANCSASNCGHPGCQAISDQCNSFSAATCPSACTKTPVACAFTNGTCPSGCTVTAARVAHCEGNIPTYCNTYTTQNSCGTSPYGCRWVQATAATCAGTSTFKCSGTYTSACTGTYVVTASSCTGTPVNPTSPIFPIVCEANSQKCGDSSGVCSNGVQVCNAEGIKLTCYQCTSDQYCNPASSRCESKPKPTNPFSLPTPTPLPPKIITFHAAAAIIPYNTSTTLTWSASQSTDCFAKGGWQDKKSTSGQAATASLKTDTTFTLTCLGLGPEATQTITVRVAAPTPTPTIKPPTVSFVADPDRISYKSSTILKWSTTGTISCTASGGWQGKKDLNGGDVTGQLTASAYYNLKCTGPGGNAEKTILITVASPTPTSTMMPLPTPIPTGTCKSGTLLCESAMGADATVEYVCNTDGKGSTQRRCPAGYLCETNDGKGCEPIPTRVPAANSCRPNDKKCTDNGIKSSSYEYVCNSSGTNYAYRKCDYGTECSGEAGCVKIVQTCTPNATRCPTTLGSAVEKCVQDASGRTSWVQSLCPTSQSCYPTTGTAGACQKDPVCSKDSISCTDNGEKAWYCNSQGTSFGEPIICKGTATCVTGVGCQTKSGSLGQSCENNGDCDQQGQFCVNNIDASGKSCAVLACDAGTYSCNANGQEVSCNTSGTKQATKTCPSGFSCLDKVGCRGYKKGGETCLTNTDCASLACYANHTCIGEPNDGLDAYATPPAISPTITPQQPPKTNLFVNILTTLISSITGLFSR